MNFSKYQLNNIYYPKMGTKSVCLQVISVYTDINIENRIIKNKMKTKACINAEPNCHWITPTKEQCRKLKNDLEHESLHGR